jgi:exportin-1
MPFQISNRKQWLPCLSVLSVILILQRQQISQFIEGLFTHSSDLSHFKLNIRDFLIQLKEFSDDNAELYAEDRETAQQQAKVAERERAAKVGGLLKPSEIDQDDEL